MAIIILVELCNEGIIDIFDMANALIKLRKLYNLPLIDISVSVCSFVRTALNIIATSYFVFLSICSIIALKSKIRFALITTPRLFGIYVSE